MIDGKIFKPARGGIGGFGADVYYKNTGFIESLSISAINSRKGGVVSINIEEEIEEGKTFNLGSPDNGSYGMYSNSFDPCYTFENASGTIKIIRFDLENGIVSGVFSFSSRNESDETVQVSEGRFDLEL